MCYQPLICMFINKVLLLLLLFYPIYLLQTHVRGHAGVPGNMEADALARAAARRS